MEIKTTERGFKLIEFNDRYGIGCSLQESSLATEAAIWFGVSDANPQICKPEQGWIPVAFPEGTLFHTRMHLTQDDVKKLMPYLQYFLENGQLPEKQII